MSSNCPREAGTAAAASGTSLLRTLLIFGAVAALVAAAIVEGRLSNRWGSEDLQAAADKLNDIPPVIGNWTSTEEPINPKILRIAEAASSVSRRYENRATGSTVSVLLLCGPTGAIAAHTPDVCYAGLGYTMHGNESRRTLAVPGGPDATYWSARFDKPNGASLVVAWAWSVDGNWVAAENPRVEYVRHRALYKLYVTRSPTRAEQENSAGGPDPTQEFMTDLLPVVRKQLAP